MCGVQTCIYFVCVSIHLMICARLASEIYQNIQIHTKIYTTIYTKTVFLYISSKPLGCFVAIRRYKWCFVFLFEKHTAHVKAMCNFSRNWSMSNPCQTMSYPCQTHVKPMSNPCSSTITKIQYEILTSKIKSCQMHTYMFCSHVVFFGSVVCLNKA